VAEGRRIVACDFGRLLGPRAGGRPLILASLAGQLEKLLADARPDIVVVETSFSARLPRAVIALAETRGALLSVLGSWGGEVAEVEPARVKSAVVGYGRAEKSQVAFMVQRHLALPTAPPPDAADALAIAICHVVSTRAGW